MTHEAQAARYTRHGLPADVLELVDLAPRSVGPGEVRCAMLASPINPSDILAICGQHVLLRSLPAVGGNEGVGRVTEVGAGCDSVSCGDLVLLPFGVGAWQTQVVIPACPLTVLPSDCDPIQLAMLAINPPTALLMLDRAASVGDGQEGATQKGDWVLQNVANSAVGQYVIQLARLRGLRTCNLVRREGLEDGLRAQGADIVIVDRGEGDGAELIARIRKQTEGRVRLGIDAIGGEATRRLAAAVGDGGLVLSYGELSGKPCQVAQHDLIFRGIRLEGFWLASWARRATQGQRADTYRKLAQLIHAGALRAHVEQTYPLSRVQEAVEHAMRDARGGKIVIVPSE